MQDGMYEHYLDLAHAAGYNACAECHQWQPTDQMVEHENYLYCPGCVPGAQHPTAHKYFLLLRPPGYAHHPAGHTAMDGGMPKHTWVTDDGRQIDAFGWVEYPEPLSMEQIWRFDLEPNDPAETAHLFFWLQANRDDDHARALEDDYLAAFYADRERFERYNEASWVAHTKALASAKDGKAY